MLMHCEDCNLDMVPDDYNEHTYVCPSCGSFKHDVEAINKRQAELERETEDNANSE
jgi:Zn finger protein HypA/HybF involved in hydrogenase expression